jgi:hypothetical protein
VARAVLATMLRVNAALVMSLALLLVGQVQAKPSPAVECSSGASVSVPQSRQKAVQDLSRRVETGPFYKELVRRTRKAGSCQVALDDQNIVLSYAFDGTARIEAKITPGIEFSEERLEMRDMTENLAIQLLKETETHFFGRMRCGMNWKQPAQEISGQQPGLREVVYRGDVCNCQARMTYDGQFVVSLVFRSAC